MKSYRKFIPLLILVFLFLVSAFVAQVHHNYLMSLVLNKDYSVLIFYTIIVALATVFAPLSTLALIPIVSNTWGIFISASANIIGWFIGALISFYISRIYGRLFVTKIVSEKKIEAIENKFLGRNVFWTIVLLRMVVPVDILSYILGLFKNISWKVYVVATFIGIIPFAFIFSYFGTLPLRYQIIEIIPIGVIIFLIMKKNKIS